MFHIAMSNKLDLNVDGLPNNTKYMDDDGLQNSVNSWCECRSTWMHQVVFIGKEEDYRLVNVDVSGVRIDCKTLN